MEWVGIISDITTIIFCISVIIWSVNKRNN